MLQSISYRSAVLAVAAVILAQPALARSHGAISGRVGWHHRHHHRLHRVVAAAYRSTWRYQRAYASAPVQYEPVESQAPDGWFGYGPQWRPTPRWQRRSLARFAAYGSGAYSAGEWQPYQQHYGRENSWSAFDSGAGRSSALDGMIAQQASANGVPLSLAHRIVRRESGGNPRAVSAGNYGLMQIRLGTAREMGYRGSAAGLLDPAVNMTYAMRYLAGAYHAAGGNEGRAVALYSRGYNAARLQTASLYTQEPAAGYFDSFDAAPTPYRVWRRSRRPT